MIDIISFMIFIPALILLWAISPVMFFIIVIGTILFIDRAAKNSDKF